MWPHLRDSSVRAALEGHLDATMTDKLAALASEEAGLVPKLELGAPALLSGAGAGCREEA
jgi:hypothetical protein